MSPYTSIRDVAATKVGNYLSTFVPDHFKNLNRMPLVKCPTFVLHGVKDPLIPIN